MPSWFGTRSEDYFGFAWATPDLFSKAYHAQVFNQGSILWKATASSTAFKSSTTCTNLTKAPDYAIVAFAIDGVACGGDLDLYAAGAPVLSGEQEPCTRALTAGDHALTLNVKGKNAASAGYFVGIDYFKLLPQ